MAGLVRSVGQTRSNGQCGRQRCQRDQREPPGQLVPERPDDQSDAATAGNVAPDRGTGGLLVKAGLEPDVTAGGDDGVVVARPHGLGPELDRLARQRCDRYVLLSGEWMVVGDCSNERLHADGVLVEPGSVARVGCQGNVDALVAEQARDVLGEDPPRPHLQLRMIGGQRIDQRRQRFVNRGERVREPQRSDFTSRCGLCQFPIGQAPTRRGGELCTFRWCWNT
jgi:hypothetical protein